ncbi:septin-interacting protein 1 isoform X2 [Plodia interpunctella]|uniref:septin-interacting protein 1 isoform X2 n=1 Tax=Plodia interpunctella TaxID=58824 RepID=UPI002367DF71|nr:septin-interacting protein 1 isoform X2 [Plodia interpunctella]
MSDDEVIRFEITDYDLDNEFNPNRNRRAKKEQQIYGVWAKDSDEDDNEDNIRQRTRKPKDFSAPIGFVAGGVQQAGKKKEEKKEIQSSEASTSRPKFAPDSSDEDEKPSNPAESETAGIRRAGQGMRPVNFGGNMGNWEKHTKGIGAKLLLQMGYQPGKGLGKDLQGISAPVEATLRKGRGAIGAYGPEKSAQKAKREEEKRLKEKEDQEKSATEKSYNWKKSHKGRYFYRDAADVIQEGKPSMHTVVTNELSRVPVIDMTGKERRVLSGYHALRAAAPRFEHEPRRRLRHFAATALAHNLQLMVDCCEQDIIQNARELKTAEDEIVVLERDLEECNMKLKEHDVVIDKMQEILRRVEALDKPDVSLEDAYEVLAELKESFPLEYETFGLGTIAGTIVSPLLSALLAPWDPLTAPDEPVQVFSKWRKLLTDEAYNSLLWQHYVPHLNTAAESWNPRDPTPMLRALTCWSDVCPPWIVSNWCARCVTPRLLAGVRAWDPTGDTLPLHTWVLPWHPHNGESLARSVYPAIRSRLASALAAWHPADGSARPLLAAWRGAWGSALTALLHQHIVPKLEHCLQMAPLELVGRENAAWLWCVDWLELLGAPTVAAIASRALLPRWLAALAAWLNTNPTHATVLNSYTDFKKMFPEEVLKEPAVRDAFRKALDMMNRSTDIETVEPPPPPRFTVTDTKETSRIADVLSSTTQQKSFSELLESRCIEKGITFVPIAGKTREGRPLYKIGDLQCYVIRNVIMYSNDGGRTFGPVSMERLLNMVEE